MIYMIYANGQFSSTYTFIINHLHSDFYQVLLSHYAKDAKGNHFKNIIEVHSNTVA